MRIFLTLLSFLCLPAAFLAQVPKLKSNKYPSLLWEITGKGKAKPSYLFGTMHVSNKMVFHLSDSFYLAIRKADVVALETNPGNWQDDFSRYELMTDPERSYRRGNQAPDDYLTINTLKAAPYDKWIEASFQANPSIINSFLYRNGSDMSSDFEEDTYLDLYIYQIGRKWNKKVCGVENFDESMNLMKEAYLDAAKEKNRRERADEAEADFSYAKLEDAYRTGNLDWLDTINRVNSRSAAFDEKFLYRRNEIQARSIDSILRTGASLFVGVGAAHLPGDRGVIELLRRMGYRLRPVRIKERDSRHKDEIENIRVPVTFRTQTAPDGFYSVPVPGKLYDFFPGVQPVSLQQYADMSNGSYYMVVRIHTDAGLWGHGPQVVERKVDSLLYENIPGKILSKKKIQRNGYPGFDILNRTRRGDYQRYQIFVTPAEVIFFKLSGSGDYILKSTESEQFFSGIQLREAKGEWKKWSPAAGGFEVLFPGTPAVTTAKDGMQFTGYDKASGNAFTVLRNDVHNFGFVEEDSFDIALLEESFGSSAFIDRQLSRNWTKAGGYTALDARYRYKDGSEALVRFLVQGPRYYTLVVAGRPLSDKAAAFIQSFSMKPFVYADAWLQRDTALRYQVQSPVLVRKEQKLTMMPENLFQVRGEDEDEPGPEELQKTADVRVANDSTGEKIYVSFFQPSPYYQDTDSMRQVDTLRFRTSKQEWVYRKRKKYTAADGYEVLDYELGDPLSSRVVRGKALRRDGKLYRIQVEGDTLSGWSPFVNTFFQTFQPLDPANGTNAKTKKSGLFFSQFFSSDTLLHRKAVRNLYQLRFDSTDLGQLQQAMASLGWKEKKYLDVKKRFIEQIGSLPSRAASDYLGTLYTAAGDTIALQYAALSALVEQKTAYAYGIVRQILLQDPPVLDLGINEYSGVTGRIRYDAERYEHENRFFLEQLQDSLDLTRTIFKDLLPLLQVNDYEKPMMAILQTMVDSGRVSGADYATLLPKFLLEAKQALKKQAIAEKSKSIVRAQAKADAKKAEDEDREDEDDGNDQLYAYSVLLLPFWDKEPAVPAFFNQVLAGNDKRLKYDVALLLLRNGKALPDTMLNFFSGLDAFRFELYHDLQKLGFLSRFPAQQRKPVLLAKSELYGLRRFNQPDTLVYLDRLPAQVKDRSGYVYFFKYRGKNEDRWKLATAGLVPLQDSAYSFVPAPGADEEEQLNFTELRTEKLEEDEALQPQLQKLLRKMLYAKRKSAAEFYGQETDYSSWTTTSRFRD